MQTVYEATGGADGLQRQANAWHARVMADEVVSHGFHPERSQPLAAYWAESLGGRTTYSDCYGGETCCAVAEELPAYYIGGPSTRFDGVGLRVLSDFRRLGMQLDVEARPRSNQS